MDNLGDELERLKKAGDYPTLTMALLNSFSDDDIEHEVFSFISKKKVKDDHAHAFDLVSKLAPGLRMLYSTWLVAMEVPNGGFNQFFWNHDARFAAMARDGYTLIGAPKLAGLMERVIRIRGMEEKELEPYYQAGTAEAFAESYKHTSLDEMDSLFYKLDDEGRSLRIRFVRSHPEAFVD